MNLPNKYLLAVLSVISALTTLRAADKLDQVFANPPPAAHPHTWWHWNNGNVNKEGITLDLEANRLIGDAALPENQRHTWTTFQPYKAEDPLLPSGLLGPVTLRAMVETPF